MFLASLVATLAAVTRRRARPGGADPDLGRALDELFAVWPLDPEEERRVRARYAAR